MKIKFTEMFLKTMVRFFGAKGFSKMYAATSESKAYTIFCERVYGRDLCQANMMDEEQLQFLIYQLKLNETHHVLDLGCGIGKITEYIHESTKANMTGIDFAFGAIELAKRRTKDNDNINFISANLNDLKNSIHKKFDVILLIDSLYFVSDIENFIQTLKRHLKPNGTLAIFYTSSNPSSKMEEQLKKSDFEYRSFDFTNNERKIWEQTIIVADELKDYFIKEGNLDIYYGRMSEAKRSLSKQPCSNISRYLYLARPSP